MRQRVQLLTHRLFGRRSEKGVTVIEQGVLPLEPAAAGPVQAETTDELQRDETLRTSITPATPSRTTSIASRFTTRAHRDNAAGH